MQNQKIILIPVAILAIASVGLSSYLFYKQQTEEPPKPGPSISFGGEPIDWTNPEAPSQSPALEPDEVPQFQVPGTRLKEEHLSNVLFKKRSTDIGDGRFGHVITRRRKRWTGNGTRCPKTV